MKVIVYAHSMEIGGSQTNAIEIGAAVQRQGHDVLLVGEPGPMGNKADALGLEQCVIAERRRRPSIPVMRQLIHLARHRGIDIIHGYEWPPALEAWFSAMLEGNASAIATVMSGTVAPFLPTTLPLVVGTALLRERCLAFGYQNVSLIEPPVDVLENSPSFAGSNLRKSLGIEPDTVLAVIVCRLARELKREGLLAACSAVGELVHRGIPLRLLIVGDGPVRKEVESAAVQAARVAGKKVVFLAGEMEDPRAAYSCADVVLGMGGSALRGMAFEKPLIVQGERGFWRICDEKSVKQFLETGWYGLGRGEDGSVVLQEQLLPLVHDHALRRRLGQFSRDLIVDRFSLEVAARSQVAIYEEVLQRRRRASAAEIARAIAGLTRYKVNRHWERLRGTAAADDFNTI